MLITSNPSTYIQHPPVHISVQTHKMFNFSINNLLSIAFLSFSFLITSPTLSLADNDNLQDTCPTSTDEEPVFINGLPCKNPSNVTSNDFTNSILNKSGDTDNFYRSSVTLVTASEFPGLNTLGLSISRTDMDVDGLVTPHSHPRASEILFVSEGIVIIGFLDTKNNGFQKVLKKGEVFVVPRGLLHYCFNAGFECASMYSVLNSQNPGVVSVTDAVFGSDHEAWIQLNKLPQPSEFVKLKALLKPERAFR